MKPSVINNFIFMIIIHNYREYVFKIRLNILLQKCVKVCSVKVLTRMNHNNNTSALIFRKLSDSFVRKAIVRFRKVKSASYIY